jgi:signal transduction histidine kinase
MSNQITALSRFIQTWLLDPHARITNPEKIQRSRLLSTILMVLIVLGITIISIVIHQDPQDIQAPEVQGAILVLVIVTAMYILNRLGYNRYAAAGVILPFVVVFTYIAFSSSGKALFLAFLLIPILLTAIFFNLRWTSLITGSVLMVIMILLSFQDQSAPASPFWTLRNMWFLLLLATGLIITFMWHLGRVEDIRQQELMRVNRELEQKIADLERFSYTVSHELKAPIVTIKGFLGSVERDLTRGNFDQARNDLIRVSKATDKMHATLSDLLNLSRAGRVRNSPEQVDLLQLAQDALQTLEGRLHSKEVSVHISDELPTIWGERSSLREVFENLIDNAVKYSADGSPIEIEIGITNLKGEKVIFVRDNGMGIDPKYSDRVFGLFEKLNPASEGTGVGLALVKRIVETHGGRIWVESEGLGKGSTFCFAIPNAAGTDKPSNKPAK